MVEDIMKQKDEIWEKTLWGLENNRDKGEELWQIFHENSKTRKILMFQ